MKVVIKIGLWSILEFDSRLESPSALPGELTGTTSAASPLLRPPSLRPAACPPAAAPRWVPGAGLRPSAAPPLLVSSRERGAGFSPVPPADLLVRACLLRLPEALPPSEPHFLVCEGAHLKGLCPAQRDLRCPEQGAWPVVDAHPAPARSSPREMLGRLLCSSFRSPNFCPAPYSQGEFFRVSHSPRPL